MKFVSKEKPKKAKKKFSKKKIIVITSVVLVAAIVAGVFLLKGKKGKDMANSTVTEAKAEKRDISVSITGTATIAPKDSYSIISLVQGDVISDYFEEGDIVSKDDTLYSIDADDIEKSIQSAEIQLQKAKNTYNDAIKTQNDLNVKSDISGAVTKVNVKKGDNVNSGTTIAEINDSSRMKIKLPFNDNDVNNIHVGDTATLSIVGTGNTVTGTVSEVASASYVKSGHMLVRDVTVVVYNPMAITTTDKATAIIGDYACNDSGTFEYYETSTITAKTSGKVEELRISEGSTVYNGQVVAVLSSDNISSTISNASLSLRDSEISLEKMRDSKDKYVITAPISGTVVTKNVKAGDKIDNSNASTELAVIYDMSLLKFEMNVDELDINQVKVGQSVKITADALDSKVYEGTITNVSVNGTTSGGVTTYPITVEITEFDDELLPGMNIDAEIVVMEQKDVLSVPVSAVNRGNTVYVKGNKTEENDMAPEGFKTVQVETGISNDSFIEIVSGINEGDIVYALSGNSTSENQMMPGMGGGMPGGMGGGMSGGGGGAPGGGMGGGPGGGGGRGGR